METQVIWQLPIQQAACNCTPGTMRVGAPSEIPHDLHTIVGLTGESDARDPNRSHPSHPSRAP